MITPQSLEVQKDPQITEDVKSALESAGDSAHRCRVVSLSLVTASVLAFMAWWNSVSWSWIHIRQAKLDDAIVYWDDTNWSGRAGLKTFIDAKWDGQGKYYGQPTEQGTNLFLHLTKLRDSLDALSDNDIRFVKVPFFGVGFDINDLGLFAGIGFSTILLILAFAMKRELANVKFYFKLLDNQKLGKVGYNLLAMRQVLTMPLVSEQEDNRTHWSFLQWLPISAPFAVQLAIVVNDFFSLNVGAAWNPTRTDGLIGTNCVSLLLVGIFTYIGFSFRKQINEEWASAFRRYFPKST